MNAFFSMNESSELFKNVPLSKIEINTFCGPESLLDTQKNRVCIQIATWEYVNGENTVVLLTRSQALELANAILDKYKDYEGGIS